MSEATVTASLAAAISLCAVRVYNHRLGRRKWRYNRSIEPAPTWNSERPKVPSLTVSVYQNLLQRRRLRNRKQNARWHRIWIRENVDSLDFNFISLLNPAVDDENWVCGHRLLRLILRKWCRTGCSDPFKLFVNGKFSDRSTFSCTDRLSFHHFCLLTL